MVSNIWYVHLDLGTAHHTYGYRAILHDADTYRDPESFNPRRFLNPDGTLNKHVPRPDAAFGYGRRICPGRYFALRSLWMTLANVLAVFSIEKAIDKDGSVIEPSAEFENNFIM